MKKKNTTQLGKAKTFIPHPSPPNALIVTAVGKTLGNNKVLELKAAIMVNSKIIRPQERKEINGYSSHTLTQQSKIKDMNHISYSSV